MLASLPGLPGLQGLENSCELVLREWGLKKPSFLFAVHEALINALEVNKNSGVVDTEFLCVQLQLSADQLTATIPDAGPGLPQNWRESCLGKDMEDLLEAECGRGLLFMQHFCSEIESGRDQAGRHIMILKAGIKSNE